ASHEVAIGDLVDRDVPTGRAERKREPTTSDARIRDLRGRPVGRKPSHEAGEAPKDHTCRLAIDGRHVRLPGLARNTGRLLRRRLYANASAGRHITGLSLGKEPDTNLIGPCLDTRGWRRGRLRCWRAARAEDQEDHSMRRSWHIALSTSPKGVTEDMRRENQQTPP